MPYCGVGDVDGDGFDDFLIAFAWATWEGARQSGVVVLVYGAPEFPAEVDFSDPGITQVRHVRFVIDVPEQFLGNTLGSAGDLNDDGMPDFAFASPSAQGTENDGDYAGRVYVVYGSTNLQGDIDVSRIGSDIPGLVIHGAYGQGPGHGIGDALGCCSKGGIFSPGDMDGDGRDDLVVMASLAFDVKGAVYLIMGSPTLPSAIFTAQPGGPLREIRGANRGMLGHSGNSGDVDGDGLQDIIFSSIVGDGGGSCYILYGRSTWPATISLEDPDLRILRFDSAPAPSPVYPPQGMEAASSIGDWDGDGFADVVFGGWSLSVRYGTNVGKAYLVYGSPSLPRFVEEQDITSGSLRGITMLGRDSLVYFGETIDPGGDFDGDGETDFAISSRYFNTHWESLHQDDDRVYIFFGGSDAGNEFAAGKVLPSDGTVHGGEQVTLVGTAFHGDEVVLFGGIPALDINIASTAEIRVRTPPSASVGPVNVEIRGSAGSATIIGGFTYVDYEPIEDVFLDPAWLESRGQRSLTYKPSDMPARGLQSTNVFFSDVNEDSIDDIVVGTPTGTAEGSRVSVLFGRKSGFPQEILPEEAPQNGFVVDGTQTDGNFGGYIAFPGDLDRDGHTDIAFGFHVLFGRPQWPERLQIAEEVERGSVVRLQTANCLGLVAGPGSIDGTGVPALILGESEQCADRISLFLEGLERGERAELSVSITKDPDPVMIPEQPIGSSTPRRLGNELKSAGDVNDDGHPDFIVGAPHAFGAFYIVLGGPFDFLSGTIRELQDIGRAVIVHHNERDSCLCGYYGTAAALGDVNGDGIDDVGLGAPLGSRDHRGAVFIVLGARELGSSITEIGLLTATKDRVLRIEGEDPDDWTGYPGALGDFNSDGFADIGIVGEGNRNTLSRAYVVFGGDNWPERTDLSQLRGRGFRIIGREGHRFSSRNGGIGAGDLDGDGFSDLAFGESGLDFSKQVVVVFGRSSTGNTRFIRGEANDDGAINITDAVFILQYLFQGTRAPSCLDAADTDDSGAVDITDGVYLLWYLFQGGRAPPSPHPSPGMDPTTDGFDC
jgi:hypothetical protein